MSYSINQYNGINENCMTILTIPPEEVSTACRRYNNDDYLYLSSPFNSNKTYFLHCWVIDNLYLQKIQVKLCKFTDDVLDPTVQNIKYFEYRARTSAEGKVWRELILVFKPLKNDFNSILLELVNRPSGNTNRHTVTIFEELCELDNLITRSFPISNINICKLGIRGRSNTLFSINSEYINIGKSGVMEFDQESTNVSSICPIIPAAETTSILETTKVNSMSNNTSACLFNYPKIRAGMDFVLDYIYEERG